jgi:outer membrane protein
LSEVVRDHWIVRLLLTPLLALSAAAASVAAAPAAAAVAQDPENVTLAEAIEIALRRNTDMLRARAELSMSRYRSTVATLEYLPQVQLSSGFTRSFGRSFSQEEGQILSETSDFFGVEVSASMELFDGFERVATNRRADREREASRLRLERTRQDVAFEVIAGFIQLMQNRELTVVREQELAAQEELLDQVQGLVEVGRQPVSDLYQQRAARAEAEAALVEARRQVELSTTRLIQILQLDPLGTYRFGEELGVATEPSSDSLTVVAAEYDLDELTERALARRPDLEALSASVDAGRQAVRAVRASYWPSLSLAFDYGSDWSSEARQFIPGTGSDPRTVQITPDGGGAPVTIPIPGSGSEPALTQPSFLDQLNSRRGGAVRLFVSVPIFDRMQTRLGVEEAELQLLNTVYDLRDTRQLVALQVRQAVLDHRSARAQLRASAERLQAAREARDAARRRYELGAATFVEVAQAESGYVAARSARVRAAYAELLARTLIEYHTGSLEVEAEPYDRGEDQ